MFVTLVFAQATFNECRKFLYYVTKHFKLGTSNKQNAQIAFKSRNTFLSINFTAGTSSQVLRHFRIKHFHIVSKGDLLMLSKHTKSKRKKVTYLQCNSQQTSIYISYTRSSI